MKRIHVSSLGVLLAVAAGGCADRGPSAPDGPGQTTPSGLVVSNPRASASPATSIGRSSVVATSASSVAYISATPGTFPGALSALLSNQTRGSVSQAVQFIDGGFDPVGVHAGPGDELSLRVSLPGGELTPLMIKVPPRRPPEVVRTNPKKGRTDVALNVQVEVVFSEPVDKSSVTQSSFQLLRDGNAVSGSVQVSPDGLTATFIPAALLEPLTTYTAVVRSGIRDMDDDVLAVASSTPFTTAAAGSVVITSRTTATNNSYLDPDGYGLSIDGQLPQLLGINESVTIANLAPGFHDITLSGVAANCVGYFGSRQVNVIPATVIVVAFEITCDANLNPEVQPDIAFEGKFAFVSERDGNSEIYTMNGDGTALTRLTNYPGNDISPAWSPDGNRIAFASDRGIVGPNPWNDGSDIYIMNSDGSNVVRLTSDGRSSAPAWSPDGRQIAFSSARQVDCCIQWGIYVMNLDDGTARNVAWDRGYQVDPAWSPDGRSIAFTSDWRAFDFLYDLYVAKVDGSGITALLQGPFFWADGPVFYFQPAWSPDGRKIAVVACEHTWDNCYPNSSVSLANADGSEVRTLVNAGGFARPAWSPDGSIIAFSSRSCRGCAATLRYIRTDGSEAGVIFSNGHSPSWHR